MKPILRLLIAVIISETLQSAQAQSNVYALNVVGYVNRVFGIGNSLFANPLTASPNNTLSSLFSPSIVPNGTQISLWNSTSGTFDISSTLSFGSWSTNLTLNPGTGARLTAPSAFTNTFVGTVLNHDGSLFSGSLTNPPVYGGPNGIYLLGDKAPVANTGSDIFLSIVGRSPNVGEQVITLTTTSTYLGGGNWDNIPSMAVSDAAFLNIGPVPEPTTITLSLLGFALIPIYRRRQR
jgi:hypothetical protein